MVQLPGRKSRLPENERVSHEGSTDRIATSKMAIYVGEASFNRVGRELGHQHLDAFGIARLVLKHT
ncbi:hypothetical protein GCM10022253_20470 [Sphingomonas endophytica]